MGAALRSERADYADLAALTGVRAADGSRDAPPEGRKAARKESARNATVPSIFPAQPLPVDALQKFEAEVSVKARELRTAGRALLHNVHVAARLAAGAIETKALDFEVAGGRVSGALAFDGASEPPAGRVVVDLNAVRLEQLFAALSLPARAAGAIDGRVDLAGRGDSVAALLASSNGSLRVNVSGGRIPNLLDAKLAPNPLAVFGAWLSSKTDVAVHCAAAALDVHGGVGEVRTIALDTDRARVEGAGRVDLGEERLDILLTPHAKRPGILDRHEAIRVRGPFRGPKVSREKRAQQESRTLLRSPRALRIVKTGTHTIFCGDCGVVPCSRLKIVCVPTLYPCTVTFAALITLPQRAISALRNSIASFGVLATGSLPPFASTSMNSFDLNAFTVSV